MTITRKFIGGVAAAALLAVPLAACSSSSTSSSSSSSAASTAPVANITSLTGEMTQVTLSSDFTGALKTLGLTATPFGTATVSADGVASFPITGGNVEVWKPGTHNPYVEGSIKHEGSGLNLAAGATKVTLENFTVDPGGKGNGVGPTLYGDVLVNGTAVASLAQAPLFALDGSTLKPLETPAGTGTAVLEGTTVRLTAPAAAALNSVFKTTAVTAGLEIGIAKITVKLPS